MIKYIAKVSIAVFGLAVVVYLLSTADFVEFKRFELGVITLLVALASFGAVASVGSFSLIIGNSSKVVTFLEVATSSLSSTTLNLVVPMVGTSGKIAHMKWGHGVALRETTFYLVLILVTRLVFGLAIFFLVYFGLILARQRETVTTFVLLLLLALIVALGLTMFKSTLYTTGKKMKTLSYLIFFDLMLFCSQAISLHIILSAYGHGDLFLSLAFASLGLALGSLPSGFFGVGLREAGILLMGQFSGIDVGVMSSIILLDRGIWIIGILIGLFFTAVTNFIFSFKKSKSS